MTKIAVFVGSLREKSLNKYLAKALEERAGDDVQFVHADIELPLFNEDVENAHYPEKAQAIKDLVESSDGVLFVTPEYNRSIPGVLKNAIDWVSRPYGTNSFKDKPMGVVGVSSNVAGTAIGQAHLRGIASFLEMKQLGRPEIYMTVTETTFDSAGVLIDERWSKNLTQYMERFVDWVQSER